MASVSDADIAKFTTEYEKDPGAIAKGMQDYGVSLQDISRATGWGQGRIGDYIKASGNDYLSQQYALWGAPPAPAATNAGSPAATGGTPQSNVPAWTEPAASNTAAAGGALSSVANATATSTETAPAAAPPVNTPAPVYAGNAALPTWATNPGAYNPQTLQSMAGPMRSAASFTPSESALTSTQLMKLLASDSPYLQRARSKAAEYSNSRGLLNSTMGAEAGEAAAIDYATPIANADASAFMDAEMASFNATNQFAMADNEFARSGALTGLKAGYDLARDDAGYKFQSQERVSKDMFTAGENALTRAFEKQERIGKQDFEAAQSVLNRAFEWRVNELKEAGATDRLATEIASREKVALEDRVFTGSENQTTREWNAWQSALTRASNEEQSQLDRDSRATEGQLNRDANAADASAGRDIQLFNTYMDARYRLETDPNMPIEAKAQAIDSLADWFYNQALPALAKGFTTPGAWPPFPSNVNAATQTPAASTSTGTTPAEPAVEFGQ